MRNKRVFVSGSSRGIGLAIAEKLSDDGFHVVIHGSPGSEETLIALSNRIKNSTYCFFDLEQNPEVHFKRVIDEHGQLYGLVNNAGILASNGLLDESYENLERIFRINTLSHFVFAREFMNQKGLTAGRIINISSNAIRYGFGRNGAVQYTATKLALEALTDGLSRLGAKQNVLVNTVRPGMVSTRIQEGRENLQERLDLIPLGRMAETSEVAELVSFFMSEKASHITGQTISIAGGE